MARYKIDQYLFDEKEKIILKSLILNNTPLEISADTTLPRTTVYFVLDKLKRRGLVKNEYEGRKKKWFLRKIEEKSILNEDCISNFKKHNNNESIENFLNNLTISNETKFKNLNGDNITEGWNKNIGAKNIIKFNKYLNKNNLVSDLISSKKSLKNNLNQFGSEWSKSFISKPTEYHLINDKYSNHGAQIFLNKNKVFIVNMNTLFVLEISDQETIKMFKSIFEFIKDNTKKISLSDFIKEIQ